MTSAWTLRVQIEDGYNFDFGFERNESVGGFFRCVFNKCINQSSIIRLPTFLSYDIQPVWNEALEWQFDNKTLKKLKKYGSSIKLQLFMIKNWDHNAMDTFPIKHFKANKQKYNVHEIGYVVLDLKTAISNGTKIKDFDDPQIDSKYLRIRNVKLVTNKGIYPKIKILFWCGLQTKWEENHQSVESPQKEDDQKQMKQSIESKAILQSSINIDQNMMRNSTNEMYINDNNDNNDNTPYIVGNKWFCLIHKLDVFVDISNLQLLIVSMNERFILKLPLNESNVNNNEFSNDYPNFSWYLQSSINSKEWSTIASYSANIHEFISNNHSKTFVFKLYGTHNKCIAAATISVSWESYINHTNTMYSSFSEDIDHLIKEEKEDTHDMDKETQQISEINQDEDEDEDVDVEEEEQYVAFNALNKVDFNDTFIETDENDCSYKYRIGIDIRSIRDLVSSFNIQCKYKYNLFDNNRLFQSHPAVLIQKSEEKSINDGFCAYEVILKANELKSNLCRCPLIIHCIHKDKYSKDVEIGYSFINLSDLLCVDKSASNLRYIDKYYAIYSIKGNVDSIATYHDLNTIKCKTIGHIRVCCSLEDFKLSSSVDKQREKKTEEIVVKDDDNKNEEITITNSFVENAKYLQQEIIEELKKWKFEQQQKWEQRWALLETEKLNELELEWKKHEEIRSEQLNKKKLEIIKLEKKLKTSLYDIESQEKKIKLEQMRIEERKRELQQNYKLKTNEIVASLKRLRNDHKMEISTLNRTINFLKNENELVSTKYRNEEKRCNEFRNELNKNKKQFDSSSIGQLELENNKLNQQIIQLNDKMEDKMKEMERLNQKINELEQTNKELQNAMVENQQKQIEKEKKQMEKLKIQLMTKSHFKQIRNDRNELLQIKNTLNKIMNHP